MAFEQITPEFGDWIAGASLFLVLRLSLVMLGLWVLGFAVSSARRGPVEGFYGVAKIAASAVRDLANWSLGRTIAMAMLAMQEAIRRRVLIVFVVFIVLILMAGWYLDVKSDHPARLYLSFVLTASNYLVVMLALFLVFLPLSYLWDGYFTVYGGLYLVALTATFIISIRMRDTLEASPA